jgi:hypothetical protein
MDELLELIAKLAGDAFDDAAKAKAKAKIEALEKKASDRTADDLKVATKRLEGEVRKAEARAKKAEDRAADASGDADARVIELRAKLADSEGAVKRLEVEATDRKKRSRLREALRLAEVPEDRRGAALDLLTVRGLDDVVLDENADDGLAGHKAALEQLQTKHPFLWKSDADGEDKGNDKGKGGGPPGIGGPGPKPPKGGGKGKTFEELGAGAVAAALGARGRKVHGIDAGASGGTN